MKSWSEITFEMFMGAILAVILFVLGYFLWMPHTIVMGSGPAYVMEEVNIDAQADSNDAAELNAWMQDVIADL